MSLDPQSAFMVLSQLLQMQMQLKGNSQHFVNDIVNLFGWKKPHILINGLY